KVILVNGKVTVARSSHCPGNVTEGNWHRQGDDIDPRGHHLACGGVAQRFEAFSDLELLFGDLGRWLADEPAGLTAEIHRPGPARRGELEVGGERKRFIGLVMERPPLEDSSGRTPDPYRVQGFDKPTLGRGPSGEEHVGAAV